MVSDSELVGRLREFLSTSDLNTTTNAIVRRRLEEDFGVNLSDKKGFIREQVDLYLQSQFEKAEENEEGEGAGGGGSEEEDCDDGEAAGGVKSEEEDEDDEEEEAEGKAKKSKGSAKKGSKKQKEEGKRRGGGFCKVCSLSPTLQDFVGAPELARTEVVKKLWIYIREKDLQDPKNRRDIICDDTLRALFGVNRINMFQMNKALAKHIWPLDSDEAVPVKSTQKEKQLKHEREEEEDAPKEKVKRQKGGTQKGGTSGGTSGFLAPIQLSDALVKFLDTGESALSRSEVVKRIWDYIKKNNLQDPSDKRRIISDEKLKELFDVDSFNGFTVSKLLTAHFIKSEK